MKKFTFLLLIILGFMHSSAQNTIFGVIYDAKTKLPLEGATLTIEALNRATFSNRNGQYSFENIVSTDFVLTVSYVGYFKQQMRFYEQPKAQELNFYLETTAQQGAEVVVRATRNTGSSPLATQNISKEEIAKINLGQDLPILLNQAVGLVTTSDAGAGIGYTGLRIRGSDATRINVTVNGIPINDSESQGVFWVNMPDLASSTQNIQIQRGVGTSTNGAGAFGGSVNVLTLGQDLKPSANVNISAGSFNTQKYNTQFATGLIENKFAFSGRLSKITSNGYIDRASSDLKSFYLNGVYYGAKSTIQAVVFSGIEKTYQSWYGTPQSRLTNDSLAMINHALNNGLSNEQTQNLLNAGRTYNFYTYDNETDNYQQDHYQLHYTRLLEHNRNFNISLHYTKGKGYYEQYREQDNLSNYGLPAIVFNTDTLSQANLIRQRWLSNDFGGFTFSYNRSNKTNELVIGGSANAYDGLHFGKITWSQWAANVPKDHQYYHNNGFKTDATFYSKWIHTFKEKWNSFIDLQYRNVIYTVKGNDNDLINYDLSRNFNFFNPKVGLTRIINVHSSAFASLSIGNREPLREDFLQNYNNSAPKPETLYDAELGYQINKGKLTLGVNAYYMHYKNQLVLTGELNDVGGNIRTNVDQSYRLGLETNWSYALSSKIIWAANIALSDNRIQEFVEVLYDYTNGYNAISNVYNNSHIAFSPAVVAASNITLKPMLRTEISLLSKYVGKQYLDNTSNEDRAITPYVTNDLRLSYTVFGNNNRKTAFTLLVNNVLSTLYASNGYTFSYIYGDLITENFYYPQAKANFLAGVNFSF